MVATRGDIFSLKFTKYRLAAGNLLSDNDRLAKNIKGNRSRKSTFDFTCKGPT